MFLHYCIFKLQLVKFINTFHILCDTTYMLHFWGFLLISGMFELIYLSTYESLWKIMMDMIVSTYLRLSTDIVNTKQLCELMKLIYGLVCNHLFECIYLYKHSWELMETIYGLIYIELFEFIYLHEHIWDWLWDCFGLISISSLG
jgi:hypothetical protein